MRVPRPTLLPALLASVIATATVVAEPPAIFVGNDFETAMVEAAKGGKLVLLDATATWCMPCKKMDQTTWVDPSVVAWLEERAIAVQFDVDRESKLARDLRVQAMPTIIVFRDGQEFDRVVGYKTSDQLLQWLEDVTDGKRAIDRLREAAGDRVNPAGRVDIRARLDLASTLARSGDLEEATEEYVWLWQNMLKFEPAMAGVRLSFMLSDMKRLAAQHEPSREAFRRLRDQSAPAATGAGDGAAVNDWLHLNKLLGDDESTLRWYDRMKGSPDAARIIDAVGNDLMEMLVARGRWKDAGTVFADPVQSMTARLRAISMGVDRLSRDQQKMVRDINARRTREMLTRLYAASLAASRESVAEDLAVLLLEDQDDATARFALVQTALQAGQPRPRHLDWLEEAKKSGDANESLRKQVEKELARFN